MAADVCVYLVGRGDDFHGVETVEGRARFDAFHLGTRVVCRLGCCGCPYRVGGYIVQIAVPVATLSGLYPVRQVVEIIGACLAYGTKYDVAAFIVYLKFLHVGDCVTGLCVDNQESLLVRSVVATSPVQTEFHCFGGALYLYDGTVVTHSFAPRLVGYGIGVCTLLGGSRKDGCRKQSD